MCKAECESEEIDKMKKFVVVSKNYKWFIDVDNRFARLIWRSSQQLYWVKKLISDQVKILHNNEITISRRKKINDVRDSKSFVLKQDLQTSRSSFDLLSSRKMIIQQEFLLDVYYAHWLKISWRRHKMIEQTNVEYRFRTKLRSSFSILKRTIIAQAQNDSSLS
jgi:hypothetical protein